MEAAAGRGMGVATRDPRGLGEILGMFGDE
jgi:hypothetical protein